MSGSLFSRVIKGGLIGGGVGALGGAAKAIKDYGGDVTVEDVLRNSWDYGTKGLALGGATGGAYHYLDNSRIKELPVKEKLVNPMETVVKVSAINNALSTYGLDFKKLATQFVQLEPTQQHDVFWNYPYKDPLKPVDSSIEQAFNMNQNFDATSSMETPGVLHRHIG